MNMIKGSALKDRYTKKLIQTINTNNIAVVKHTAVDLVAAQDLKYKKVRAVINCDKTIDAECSLDGVKYLLDNNIKIFDVYDREFFDMVCDGDSICINNNQIFINNIFHTYCSPITKNMVLKVVKDSLKDAEGKKRNFIKNTIYYMGYELDYFMGDNDIPKINTDIGNKEVLIVSRGRGYREDLKAIKNYIINRKPIIIGVDGGADAVTDIGLRCSIITGDMDSVSDKSLMHCDEILVHTYCDGYAPGLNRIKNANLNYKLIQLKGTSEDAAIYMSKLLGSSKIYLIGSHTCADEFMEKGRSGMGSTALLRITDGAGIIDLKGISGITKYNKKDYKRISAAVILIALLSAVLLNSNYLTEYIQVSLKALFNIN